MPKPPDRSGRGVIYGQVFAAERLPLPANKVTDGLHNRSASQDAHRASFLQRRAPILHFAVTSYSSSHPSVPASPLIRSLLQSHRVDDAVKLQCKETGEREWLVRRRAQAIARKMSADVRLWAVKMLGYGLGHLWRLLFRDQIFVDQEGLRRLSCLPGSCPVVYLPTHRSHVDYLLLSYVLFSRDITVPHIAAGDNLQIPLLGWVMRKGGAFFMRRSIRGSQDENVYKAVLAEYIQTLLQKGQSLEFFIEGGRGRDGKVCVPKLGLLSLVFDSVLDGHVPDVYLVPMAIDYDVVLDEPSYIRQSLGLKKARETLLQALRAFWSALWRDNGRVYVTFSEPVSLRDWLHAKQGGATGERRSSLVGSETRHRLQDKLAAFHAASAEAASPGAKLPPARLSETSVKDRAAVFQNGGPVHEAEKAPPSPQPEKGRSLERRASAVGALAAQFNAAGGSKAPMPSPQLVKAASSRRPPTSPVQDARKSWNGNGSSEKAERATAESPDGEAKGGVPEVETVSATAAESKAEPSNGELDTDVDEKTADKGTSKKDEYIDSNVHKPELLKDGAGVPSPPPRELPVEPGEAEALSVPAATGEPAIDRVYVGKEQRRELVAALGEEVGAAIRRSVAATPTALVAVALLTARDGTGLEREECAAAVDYVGWQVLARGGQIAVAGGVPWGREAAQEAVEEGVRLLGPCVSVCGTRMRAVRSPQRRLTLQYHCNQLVYLFAGEALVACAFASALSETRAGDTARRRSTIPRSTIAEKARWLRRLMRAEFDPLVGAADTDALWEEQLAAYLDRLVQEEAVLSLDGGRQLRPASRDPDANTLEARGVLTWAAALVRPHIRTYAYALRCLLALSNRPPLPDAAIVAALQAACAEPLLPSPSEAPAALAPSDAAPSEDILPSVFVLRGLLSTVNAMGLLPQGCSKEPLSPGGQPGDFSRVESLVDFAPLMQQAEKFGHSEGPGAAVEDVSVTQQLQAVAVMLDGFAAPLRI
ncbi:glycerol-3-phosphate acyltransferase [Klebsormidium nitens]|uniref:Glycerol-3-phosphate acyltransferase n=1 Tax=Klebsormidium nitens TaxID=105231 RepID=A0A0U9HPR7_KLENI|nr:glycerol-3-phosphate acyltransferase [Klebsormidium nitens]|eukprot:GAQ77623.1 glycerol-3-phosphate acyltransferase [Klebsormidium nitens]